ncbi:MAG TPA: Holliday junction branch migration protein RuvA [Candidatus Polarisedimenticolia bacterium]|nr:Holliday junction branch migration protein RuvA [Candidatus Polarisedimenticolia bacterium]
MIARLRGTLLEKRPGSAVIDVRGVGYEVTLTLGTYERLGEPGEPVDLHIFTYVRQEALSLFGFADRRERALFTCLIAVNGVGPRLAIAALSGLGADGLIDAIEARDAGRLAAVPGIGRKTSERLLLDLGDRLTALGGAGTTGVAAGGRAPRAGAREDVISALTNLGYNDRVASDAVRRVMQSSADSAPGSFEELLKQTLRLLAR